MGFASSVKAKGSFTQSLHPDSKVPWMAVDDAGKFNAGRNNKKSWTYGTSDFIEFYFYSLRYMC